MIELNQAGSTKIALYACIAAYENDDASFVCLDSFFHATVTTVSKSKMLVDDDSLQLAKLQSFDLGLEISNTCSTM